MQTFTFNGFLELAGSFPPTLNTELNPTQLKVEETPACYGVDCGNDGRLASGSCPVGTARNAPIKTISATNYYWYYDRLWRSSSAVLSYGIPKVDDIYFPQDLGKFVADATIIEPVALADDQMAVVTATGTHMMSNCADVRGYFALGRFWQELGADGTTKISVLGGNLVVSNTSGVFMFVDGSVKELTRKVRDTLGSFSNCAILCNYTKNWIIGTSKFAIDVANGKLFDYGTAGFLFTSRTLTADDENRPFSVEGLAFVLEQANANGGTISWQTKFEDGDWKDEQNIEVKYQPEQYTRIEKSIQRTGTTCRRFAMRITALSSNIYIKSIQAQVQGFAQSVPSE